MEPKMKTMNEPSAGTYHLGAGTAIRWTIVALALGLAFEILFYGHRVGISYPILIGLCVLALLGLALAGRIKPALAELLLIVPILLLAAVIAIRREGLTVFLALTLSLALFAIWVRVFRSDRLASFGWVDLLVALVVVPLESWIRPWSVLGEVQGALVRSDGGRKRTFAIGRGLLLAFPILVVLIVLLSAADLIFADYVRQVLSWFNLEVLFEYYGRMMFVLLSGLFFLGALVIALRSPTAKKLTGEERPLIAPFLGFTEALVVLLLVNMLFLLFVIIQFVYLFGGEANIAASGFTYSEYARRGFGELVGVAVFSLGLIVSLGTLTRRMNTTQERAFILASSILVGLVMIMLFSALERLLLYENAYGFTRLRTQTHVAILWMGFLFLVFIILLVANRLRGFALAAVFTVLGFAASLAIMNVDGFIVRKNVARLDRTDEIDLTYLISLSEDAIPDLVRFAQNSSVDPRDPLLPQLSCLQAQLSAEEDSWPSYHFAPARARAALETIQEQLNPYFAYQDNDGVWKVLIRGEQEFCYSQPWAWFGD